ncbi:MAG: class I SAM-dependent methyltransferase [Dehalococcoidia bacterium]|nr:class I SAM-dependent methyltransferase [Dehalococcoidia bacterium]MDW8119895.1 class I SAM-dependent methyltransferase [Chloroflexota bacterium]
MVDLLQQVRAFWDRRPCNIRHSNKPVGTREYFDEVEARRYFVEPHIPGFAQFWRWKGKKVLEIGCGIGTDAVNFARAGADITAVDLSPRSLDIARQGFAVYGLSGRFFCGNAEELSSFVPVEPYDLIYSFGVIHHTPHPERVIEEIKKYCAPHTEVRVMLYAKWSWKVFWIVMKYGRGAFWRTRQLVRRYSEAQEGSPVTYTYSFRDVRRLFKDFRIVEMHKKHIFPYKIDKYIRYQYEWVWYFRLLPTPWFRWLEHRLGWHILIVAKPGWL